jgi:molybdopterin converting factor small subunit
MHGWFSFFAILRHATVQALMSEMSQSSEIQLRVFAGIQESLGQSSVGVVVWDGVTPAQIKDEVARHYPHAAALVRASRVACNHTFVEDKLRLELSQILRDELALIPPVSGG